MTFDQEFNSCMPLNMMAPENFNGATSTDTPGDDATAALGDAQTGWLVDGIWRPLQDYPTWAGNAPQQEYHSDFTGHGSWVLASSQAQLYNQIPGDYLVPYPYWFDPNWADLSPSRGNGLLHLETIQQSTPNTYESLYLPAPVEGGYYNANITRISVSLHPDLPVDEGTILGMSSAVVGKAADTSISAPSEHLHRKAGKKGGKKGVAMIERVHDCAYDGREEPLERGRLGYGKPCAIYQRLSRLKTEALDYVILREGDAHGVDPNSGSYICRVQASILGGIWRRDERVCSKRLQDKDCYRRHLEEQHFGLRRVVDGKYVPIETRIRRALEQIKEHEILKTEKGGRPTKKRKRASDEDEYVGSSLSEREDETKKRRRAESF